MRLSRTAAALAAAVALAGCFDEPVPAEKTVPPEARVYLQDRKLKDLSSCKALFAKAETIDYVNLDRNELEKFPEELATLKSLKWLRLNSNRLSSLPDLSALVSLRRIYLSHNRFDKVPETLSKLPSLTDIDLSNNPISEIPDWLAAKTGLESLNFSGTGVKALPKDLSAWKDSLILLRLGDLKLAPEEMSRIRTALPGTTVAF